MTRSCLWREIAATLAAEIALGHFPGGSRLPSEAELAARFAVNRHTVRRALSDLAGRGLVHARRGAGVFVTGGAGDHPPGRRERFHHLLPALGQVPSRRLTRIDTRPSDAREAAALGIVPGADVHVVEGVSVVDGEPIAAFRSVFPAARLPGLPAALDADPSIPAALAACGIAETTRASTRLTAEAARPMLALHLKLAEGAPVLRSMAVNVDAGGKPVEVGTLWFAGERVTLTVQESAPQAR